MLWRMLSRLETQIQKNIWIRAKVIRLHFVYFHASTVVTHFMTLDAPSLIHVAQKIDCMGTSSPSKQKSLAMV
jgi:hypothetical protein